MDPSSTGPGRSLPPAKHVVVSVENSGRATSPRIVLADFRAHLSLNCRSNGSNDLCAIQTRMLRVKQGTPMLRNNSVSPTDVILEY